MSAYTRKIYDAVHGFIRFNELERELIDSVCFQRLHHIHQLGIAFLVYPGATHTRFEHSLGTMELATRIFEHLVRKQMKLEEPEYWLQIVRLGALCHDVGHLPFSHDAESLILGKDGHEHWTVRLIQSEYLYPIWDKLAQLFPHHNVAEDVVHVAVGEEKLKSLGWDVHLPASKKILSEIITADFFGADRIDYLLRDAKCTGVSYGIFDYHQLIETLCLIPLAEYTLGVEGNGIESCEALLLARHFMHKRVYQYSSVQAHKFHVKRFMQAYYSQGDYLGSLQKYLSQSDPEILSALRAAACNPHAKGAKDADAVMRRASRFCPIALHASITENVLQKMQHTLGLSNEDIAWHVMPPLAEKALSFPVLLPSGSVVDASQLSEIRIPSGKKSWLFLSPQNEKQLRSEILRRLSCC